MSRRPGLALAARTLGAGRARGRNEQLEGSLVVGATQLPCSRLAANEARSSFIHSWPLQSHLLRESESLIAALVVASLSCGGAEGVIANGRRRRQRVAAKPVQLSMELRQRARKTNSRLFCLFNLT